MHLRTQFILAAGALLSLVAAAHAAGAGPVVLSPRVITLPPNASQARFVDLNGDGRRSLLVMDPVAKRVLNYRQGPNGFDDTPGQVIPLPPQTAWIAACDVAAHPGLELLVSTATGVVYFRQNAGLFESAAQTLIQGSQVFTNFDFPFLTSLTTNVATPAGTNDLIPVISARQVVLYHRNKTYEWKPGAPVTLDVADTAWWVTRDPWGDPWTLGANPGHRWGMTRSFRPKQEENPAREPASEMVRKIVEDMEGNEAATQPETNRVDLNADGREDLVLWQVSGTLDCKTDIYLFLRGADQSLPERPTQILHCHGFPVPITAVQNRF